MSNSFKNEKRVLESARREVSKAQESGTEDGIEWYDGDRYLGYASPSDMEAGDFVRHSCEHGSGGSFMVKRGTACPNEQFGCEFFAECSKSPKAEGDDWEDDWPPEKDMAELEVEIDPGTVVSGTHRTQDLIPALLDELERVAPRAHEQLVAAAHGPVPSHAREDEDSEWWDSEEAHSLVNTLMDELNYWAPEGMYFGAHPGDGSDFGWWADEGPFSEKRGRRTEGRFRVTLDGTQDPVWVMDQINDFDPDAGVTIVQGNREMTVSTTQMGTGSLGNIPGVKSVKEIGTESASRTEASDGVKQAAEFLASDEGAPYFDLMTAHWSESTKIPREVFDALDGMLEPVQDFLGVDSGDFAAAYFDYSGITSPFGNFLQQVQSYAAAELAHRFGISELDTKRAIALAKSMKATKESASPRESGSVDFTKGGTQNSDGTWDFDGTVDISGLGLKSMPLKYGRVGGNFDCGANKLTSLEGAPTSVGGSFKCIVNKLTSLKGAPKSVGGEFDCGANKLTSLEGAPKSVGGNFFCYENDLTSLEGAPERVYGHFSCALNQLTSLEGAPEGVAGDFDCSHNRLTSLKGAPESVDGGFFCYGNELTSLEGAPESVEGDFDCTRNELTSLKGAPKSVGGNFFCYYNRLTSLKGAPRIVRGSFICNGNPELPQEEIERYRSTGAVMGLMPERKARSRESVGFAVEDEGASPWERGDDPAIVTLVDLRPCKHSEFSQFARFEQEDGTPAFFRNQRELIIDKGSAEVGDCFKVRPIDVVNTFTSPFVNGRPKLTARVAGDSRKESRWWLSAHAVRPSGVRESVEVRRPKDVEFEVFAYCDADSGEAFDLSKEAHKSGARDDIWLRMQGPLQHDSPPDAPKGSIELRFRVTAGSAEEAMERVGELAERAGVKVESEDLVARTVSDGRARREMASPNEAITVEVRKFLQAVIEGLPDNLTHEQSEIKPFTRRGELYAWGEGTDTSDFPFEWTVSAFVMTDGGRPIVKIMAWAKSSMMQSDATREWSVNFNEDLDEFVEVVVGWIKDTAGYRRESRRVEWKYEPGDWASMMTKLRRDAFVRGYVRALMFVNPHNEEMTLSDVAIEELEKAVEDAEAFRKANADLLDDAYAVEGYDEEQAGHDLALTRNFHGAGFWDSGLGKIGDDLTAAAEKLGDFNFSDASTRESRRRRLERAGVSSVPSSVVRVDADGFVEKLGSLDYGDLGCSEEDFIALLSAAEVVASEGEEVSKFDLYRAASDLGHGVSAAADAAWDAIVGESRGRGRRRAEGEEAMPSGYERYWDIIDMVENHGVTWDALFDELIKSMSNEEARETLSFIRRMYDLPEFEVEGEYDRNADATDMVENHGVTWDALFDEMVSAMSNRQAWEHFSHARSMLGIPEFDPEKYDAEHHSGMTPHDWVRR